MEVTSLLMRASIVSQGVGQVLALGEVEGRRLGHVRKRSDGGASAVCNGKGV